jgi:hypothetical protein
MTPAFASKSGVLVIVAVLTTGARLQQQPLAVEGRGLLPEVSQSRGDMPGETPPERPFILDSASGVLSRTVFTDNAPGFHIEIRDYVTPPDHKPHTVALQGVAALVQARSSNNALQLGEEPFALKPEAMRVLPPTDQLRFRNRGDRLSVTRVILLQARQP